MKKKKRGASKRKTVKRRLGAKSRAKKTPKAIKRRPLKKRPPTKQARRAVPAKIPGGTVVGTVTHYFPKVRAAVVKLKAPLAIGDTIKIKGHTSDFQQGVTSMQIDHVPVNVAKKGEEIGLLVESRVRRRDVVYKIQ